MAVTGCAIFAALLVVLVVVLVAAAGRAAAARRGAALAGLWVGDPAFLAQAQLDDFQLFIAPARGGARAGYLLMTDAAGGYLANGPVVLREASRPWCAVRAAFGAREARGRPARLEGGAPLPAELTLELAPAEGTLALYAGDRLYAFLLKDPAASAAGLAAWAGPDAPLADAAPV